jgi:hypothetical protein
MQTFVAAVIVFAGGFVIMAMEIIGERFLAKDFGDSFYVWVNQIGLVLVAMALGYALGGVLVDRWRRLNRLAWLLLPAGVFTFGIPDFSAHLIDLIVLRHPAGEPIPPLWVALDPVLGSAAIFLPPCLALATLSPYMIGLATHSLARVGRASGLIFAASTAGSIAGVFISGYLLIEHLRISIIFRTMGALVVLLGVLCVALDRLFTPPASRVHYD